MQVENFFLAPLPCLLYNASNSEWEAMPVAGLPIPSLPQEGLSMPVLTPPG
jgi:hypothetical protein